MTVMSFWDKNREILQKQYGGLFEEITSSNEDNITLEDFKIETTPAGYPTLCIKGIHIHSPRDPLREGQRLAEAISAGDGPVIILGFGLGYTAQAAALAAAETGRPVVIAEKHASLLLKAMELRDFTEFLSYKKLIFVVGGTGEGITDALGIAAKLVSIKNTSEKIIPSVIRSRALIGLDEDWYRSVEDRIRTWTTKDEVNAATLKRFGKRWVRNLLRNMSAIRDYPGVSHLEGLAVKEETLPVFLAAAGPSLDKTAPILSDIHRRCIVVAVDTNLRFFAKNKVQPDFVLIVDPQFWNSRHLDRCVCDSTCLQTALVAESSVYPPVLKLPFKNIFLCGSMFPLGSFIENQVDQKGRLGAGGSVATTAWDFARILGAHEIWIAGLDLAFPDLKTHYRGALFEDRANAACNKFNPAEKWTLNALRNGVPFMARSAAGGQVLTDKRLSLYAAWFENRFRCFPDVRNYSLFQDGLAMPGLHAAAADDLLALPDRRDEIDRRIKAAFLQTDITFNEPEVKQKRTERYEKAVSVLTSELTNIRDTAEKGAEIARRALRGGLNSKQKNKILEELDAATRRVTESEVKEIAGFLFPQAENESETPEAANKSNTANDPFFSYLKSSYKLFSSLAETAGFNIKNIISCLSGRNC
jgi:hypothetical protein